MKKLRKIDVETIKNNGDWAVFGLISGAEKKGSQLVVELPHQVRQALIDNTFYTTLDLMMLKGLEGKYAIILYEMAIRYQKAQIPEMTIEEFRKLTGTENNYNDFGVLRHKVLTPALEEINSDKTDIILDYTTTNKGKKTMTIKFFVKQKPKPRIKEISAASEILATTEQLTIDAVIEVVELEEIAKILKPIEVDAAELVKVIKANDIDLELLQQYVNVIKNNEKNVAKKIGTLIYAFKHKMTPESVSVMIKSNKDKLSNRDNFEQREYSDEYWSTFFTNKP
ncbi:replication initiation protein [Ruminiclostridium josui]|uniref:replication initiation protein n=1 Tax=Ruminiclostridium josui TaxID=1499 RepID=UPI001FA74B46|nr:replication initiation protein [Ruminiclostridium josui]